MQHQENLSESEATRPASFLDRITDEAAQLGVALDVWEEVDRIDLHWFARQPGSAVASSGHIMDLLCAYADHTQRFILMQVETESYVPWGFVALPVAQAEDYFPRWNQTMIRRPVRFGLA